LGGVAPDNAKQSVLTHGQEKAPSETLPGPAAQREAKMMNQSFQPRRPAGEGTGNRRLKALHEYPLTAIGPKATEPARHDLDPNRFPL
jgi:hypothetical protein